ncbi:Mannosyltransferase aptg1 [Sarracenia purpurea var. burkii]
MRHRKNADIVDDKDRTENPIASLREELITSSSNLTFSCRRIFIICLAIRMVNSLLVQTYFNPDEHWQSLEVAHRISFGYGHLTWEWKKGIRSYLHPMVFALLYKILSLFHLDTPLFMRKAPRLLQSIFSAVGDLYLYKLSHVLFGEHVAQWALFSQLTNWFMFYCFTRTLSNSLETVLTLVGLYYWPCIRVSTSDVPSVSRKWGLVVAALACAIRPTSAITWAYVGLLELLMTRDKLRFIFLEVAPIGVLVLALACLMDRLMYGSWVLVPFNFLKFNFLSSGGDYYGTHKWHWYFTQGFSVMLFTFLPFSIAGNIWSKKWKLSGLIAWVLGFYSVLGHKEFRFVLPVLPIALIFSGYSLATIGNPDSSYGRRKGSSTIQTKCPSKKHLAVFLLLATNLPMAFYMSLVHQDTNEIEYKLTEGICDFAQKAHDGKVLNVLFLMPCHATPYYSTMHRNLPMRFLDCSPSEEKGVIDESDRFMMDPAGFASEFARNWSLPSHIVLFDSQEKLLKDFLLTHSFQEEKRFFQAHFKVDRDLQAWVVVYSFKGQ